MRWRLTLLALSVWALRDNGALPGSATPEETRAMMVHEAASSAVLVASLNLRQT